MTQSITVANDDTLNDLIRSVTRRLVLLAPVVSRRVAEAIINRWNALPPNAVSVVLDMDPEVYRLGYGDPDALLMLEEAARRLERALNRQRGIRIGLRSSSRLVRPVKRHQIQLRRRQRINDRFRGPGAYVGTDYSWPLLEPQTKQIRSLIS